MWPLPGEGLDRVLAAETAVDQLYRWALTEWAPTARLAALPTFHGAVTAAVGDPLPVDAAAVESDSEWGLIAESIVVAGAGVLFSAAVVEAMKGIGTPSLMALGASFPALAALFSQESAGKPLVAPRSGDLVDVGDLGKQSDGGGDNRVKPFPADVTSSGSGLFPQESATNPQVAPRADRVLAIIEQVSSDLDTDQLREAMRLVDETPALAAARDDILAAERREAARIPAVVARKIEMAVRDARPDDTGTVTLAAQRSAAADVLDPDGEVMTDLASASWHESAAVQNHAVMAVAELDPDRDQLEKVWIATLDGKTRPTHWAADGARVPLAAPFIVGGEPLQYPADPAGSPGETYSCRCRIGILARDEPLPDEVDRHTERLDGRDSVAVNRDGRSQQGEIDKRRRDGNTRARDNADGVGTVAAAAPNQGDEMDPDTDAGETFLTFTDALFAVTGVPTDDRRMLHGDIELSFRDFPLPLQWQEMTEDGHKRSVTVGVIETMSHKNGEVRGSGYMLNNEHAAKALDLLQHKVAKPSVDMADATAVLTFADGSQVTEETAKSGQPMFESYTKGIVTAATLVAIPAYGQTGLSLNAERERRGVTDAEAALVAAAPAQPVYDRALFAGADPNLLKPMRLTLDPESGRVFGFIATWKDQHRSVGLGNIRPPRSETGYEHFHTSPGVQLSDGTTLPVGRLTVGIGHAPTRGISAAVAMAHYDNVAACWALGRISEHRLGIFFSGVVAPWASPEKVQMGLASPVSGDWRPIGPSRNLELVAVLSVNTPGFLCKVESDESGAPLAMVASMGLAAESAVEASPSWSLDDIRGVMRDVLTEHQDVSERTVRLAVTADRAQALFGDPEPELSPTERMAAMLEERAACTFEGAVRKVKDSNYWGLPVGTPLRKGQKPEGKRARGNRRAAENPPKAGSPEAAARNREVERSAKSDASARERDRNRFKSKLTDTERRAAAKQEEKRSEKRRASEKANGAFERPQPGRPTLKSGGQVVKDRSGAETVKGGADDLERQRADVKDQIAQLTSQIDADKRDGKNVSELLKKQQLLRDKERSLMPQNIPVEGSADEKRYAELNKELNDLFDRRDKLSRGPDCLSVRD